MGDGFEPGGCKIMITQWPHHHTWSGYTPLRATEHDNYRRSIYTAQNMNMINYISYLITKPKTKRELTK